jgi:hypothetical protein
MKYVKEVFFTALMVVAGVYTYYIQTVADNTAWQGQCIVLQVTSSGTGPIVECNGVRHRMFLKRRSEVGVNDAVHCRINGFGNAVCGN